MTETLQCTDTLQRIGYTVINDVRVAQYALVLPVDNPAGMRITMTRLDATLYEENLETCMDDYMIFQRMAFQLRDEYLAKLDN